MIKKRLFQSVAFLALLTITALANPSQAADGIDADLKEVQEIQNKAKATYDGFNQSNPLSTDFNKSLSPGVGVPSSVAALQKYMASPYVQNTLSLLSNPKLRDAVDQISQSPKRMWILYTEVAWFFIFIIFRAWQASKAHSRSWFRALISRFVGSLVFIAVSSFVIPSLYLGEPFIRMYSIIFSSLMKL